MQLKFVAVNDNVFQLRPWTPLGDFRSPDRLTCAVLKFPFQNSLLHSRVYVAAGEMYVYRIAQKSDKISRNVI